MESKIIQKEKERQHKYLSDLFEAESRGCSGDIYPKSYMSEHKMSLINLKEYMEEEVTKISGGIGDVGMFHEVYAEIKEDIEELTKMIEAYK